jgi:hypothetical protein
MLDPYRTTIPYRHSCHSRAGGDNIAAARRPIVCGRHGSFAARRRRRWRIARPGDLVLVLRQSARLG